MNSLFCIRTITCFVRLQQKPSPPSSDNDDDDDDLDLAWKNSLSHAVDLLRKVEKSLTDHGYTVQTVRIATNPFGEWLVPPQNAAAAAATEEVKGEDTTGVVAPAPAAAVSTATGLLQRRLNQLDQFLDQRQIQFCSLGPAVTPNEARWFCPLIVQASPRFSCSAVLEDADTAMATACAEAVQTIASAESPLFVRNGLGNFRFAVAACCTPYIPYFPVAKSCSNNEQHHQHQQQQSLRELAFAIGLENGALAAHFLSRCTSLSDVSTVFAQGMREILLPIQTICESFVGVVPGEKAVSINSEEEETTTTTVVTFQGTDTSLNPSLDEFGSVARAMELLPEVTVFGGPGTVAAASCITRALQSLPDIKRTGYCGLMLPLCEDTRLAELSTQRTATTRAGAPCLSIPNLLTISSVCGVGVDTVPVPGDCTVDELKGLFLDVAGLAHRWNKSLSCRVFPVPGKQAGDWTTFDSPFMVNAKIMRLNNNPA